MTEPASFGSRDVPLADKQGLVDDVFHGVARRYDLMNDLMSAGLHRLWKSALVDAINPPRKGRAWSALDVAGGTGDIAFRIAERSHGHARVTVADINASMLEVGRERASRRGLESIEFVEANAEALPFEDRAFDAYSVAFGIRNVPRTAVALGEAFRVLKTGGRFLCLEFGAVDLPGLTEIYARYSDRVIPVLGRVVTGDAGPYRYLVESIRRFPSGEAFAGMVLAAGFARVTARPLSGGVAWLTSGWKL